MWAASIGHIAMMEMLLSTGKIDVGSTGANGHIALYWAAWNRDERMMQFLLRIGLFKVSRDDWGMDSPPWTARKIIRARRRAGREFAVLSKRMRDLARARL